ncbi:hypothetical protein Hdeb2414_s0070g00772781 [Helianthus debilis subsp. tardiflorus]
MLKLIDLIMIVINFCNVSSHIGSALVSSGFSLIPLLNWLLYQVHLSNAKKSSATTEIKHKLDNDSGKDIFNLGRKDLLPKVKGTKTKQ